MPTAIGVSCDEPLLRIHTRSLPANAFNPPWDRGQCGFYVCETPTICASFSHWKYQVHEISGYPSHSKAPPQKETAASPEDQVQRRMLAVLGRCQCLNLPCGGQAPQEGSL